MPKSSFLNAVDNDNARPEPTAKEKIGSKLRMCIKVRKFVCIGRFRTNGLMRNQHDAVLSNECEKVIVCVTFKFTGA